MAAAESLPFTTNCTPCDLPTQTNFSALSTYVYTMPQFRTNSSLSAADEVSACIGCDLPPHSIHM